MTDQFYNVRSLATAHALSAGQDLYRAARASAKMWGSPPYSSLIGALVEHFKAHSFRGELGIPSHDLFNALYISPIRTVDLVELTVSALRRGDNG